jgi:hypothetical protein
MKNLENSNEIACILSKAKQAIAEKSMQLE